MLLHVHVLDGNQPVRLPDALVLVKRADGLVPPLAGPRGVAHLHGDERVTAPTVLSEHAPCEVDEAGIVGEDGRLTGLRWRWSPPLGIDAEIVGVQAHPGGMVVGIAQDDPELRVMEQSPKQTTRIVYPHAQRMHGHGDKRQPVSRGLPDEPVLDRLGEQDQKPDEVLEVLEEDVAEGGRGWPRVWWGCRRGSFRGE